MLTNKQRVLILKGKRYMGLVYYIAVGKVIIPIELSVVGVN